MLALSHDEYCEAHEPLSALLRQVLQLPVVPELPDVPLLPPLHTPE